MKRAQGLRGKTVVVTRPRRQAAALTKALKSAGARPGCAPLIRVAPPRSHSRLDRALRSLPDFDCVVFASRNAVERFFARARSLRLRLSPPRRAAAVGAETAKALKAEGWRSAPLPEKFNGAALARSLGKPRGLRVLVPRAEAGSDDLPRILRRRGALVTCAAAYRTVPDAAGARRLRAVAKKGVDAVTFTSPSTVEGFIDALGTAQARRVLARAAAVSIGPLTSAALRRRGFRPVQAPQATASGLVRALSARFPAASGGDGGRPAC